MVLSQEKCIDDSGLSCGYDHYLLDQWWESLSATPKIYQFGKVSDFRLRFSVSGLVVMEYGGDYIIMNPLYHEKVHITSSEELRSREIYGVFFHPSLEEYCTLWRIPVPGDFTEYKILTLGSKPCWRSLNNPWSHMARVWRIAPVLIDEHLYWVVVQPESGYTFGGTLRADIMDFDIIKDEFTVVSSPVPGHHGYRQYYNTSLIDIGGFLSLVRISPKGPTFNKQFEVNIWTLKDRTAQLWTMSSFSAINTEPFFAYRKPIALVNDELVIHDGRHVLSCNLKVGTLRKSGDVRDKGYFLTTHRMSIVSLRNCKSEIYIDKRGEVVKNRKKRRWGISGGVD